MAREVLYLMATNIDRMNSSFSVSVANKSQGEILAKWRSNLLNPTLNLLPSALKKDVILSRGEERFLAQGCWPNQVGEHVAIIQYDWLKECEDFSVVETIEKRAEQGWDIEALESIIRYFHVHPGFIQSDRRDVKILINKMSKELEDG